MIPTEQQIREILSGTVKKSGKHLICTCWKCGRELKYYYNTINGFSDCKVCSRGFNLFQFLQGWNALHLLQGNQVDFVHLKTLQEQYGKPEENNIEIKDSRLPFGFRPTKWNDNNPYTNYLKQRKYTEQDFQLYNPGYTELLTRFEGYVIIPIYRNWSVKGFIARNIFDDDRLRYQNKKGTQFAKLLDGYDEITENTETAIVVEGHFDRISVKNELLLSEWEQLRALSTFGKKMTQFQIELLKTTNIKRLYFLYDMADAVNAIREFGTIIKRQFEVFGCYGVTEKDPGKMSTTEILHFINNAEPIENFTYNHIQHNALH